MNKWDADDWAFLFLFGGFGILIACIGIAFLLDVGFKVGGCP